MTLSRREVVLALIAALVVAATAATLMLTLGGDGDDQADSAAAATSGPVSVSYQATPEDEYIDALNDSGTLEYTIDGDGRLRSLWVIDGRDACDTLRANNGDIVDARFAMIEQLSDFSAEGEGMSEDGLTDRAIAVVDAATSHLCPGVTAR